MEVDPMIPSNHSTGGILRGKLLISAFIAGFWMGIATLFNLLFKLPAQCVFGFTIFTFIFSFGGLCMLGHND